MNDMLTRCPWVDIRKSDYIYYHDSEWGVPVHDDIKIFEFLILESAQAGLNWYTILKKRENYKKVFMNFIPEKVALFGKNEISKLLENPGIIRNRLKIDAAVNNAKLFLKVQEEFGSFNEYIWRFVNGTPIVNKFKSHEDYPVTTKESDSLSRDLKQRGFKFFGSTTCYAYMQAIGMVNGHTTICFRRDEIIKMY